MSRKNIERDMACPSCQSVGRDKTGNHLVVFKDSGNKWCERCNFFILGGSGLVLNWGNLPHGSELPPEVTDSGDSKTVGNTYSESDDTMEMSIGGYESASNDELTTIASLPTSERDRGIRETTMALYGVRFEFDSGDRSITKHCYPRYSDDDLVNYKVRKCAEKKFMVIGKSTKGMKLDLWGIHALKKRHGLNVVITEGELDAMSAYDMLESTVPDVACVSLTNGAASAKQCIQDNIDFLEKANSIILCYDKDEQGEKAVEATWKQLPSVKVMKLPLKDANECLVNGKKTEFVSAYHNASVYKPASVATIESMDALQITQPIQRGLDYPWVSLNNITYGMHLNQIVGIGAAPGAGKTTIVRGIQQHLMYHHKERIGILSLEEKPERTARLIIGYIMNKVIHKPDVIYDVNEAERIRKDLEGRASFYSSTHYNGEWEEIEQFIRGEYVSGVRFFFIDPLSALVSHLTPSEGNTYIGRAMYSLSKLVQQLDITVYHINHLNTAGDGKSHEAGARVYSSQFTGSRAQWRYSHTMIGLERDQLATDGTERELIVRMLKERDYGNTGRYCTLEYNDITGRYDDIKTTF